MEQCQIISDYPKRVIARVKVFIDEYCIITDLWWNIKQTQYNTADYFLWSLYESLHSQLCWLVSTLTIRKINREASSPTLSLTTVSFVSKRKIHFSNDL